jgi:hypothetical protein
MRKIIRRHHLHEPFNARCLVSVLHVTSTPFVRHAADQRSGAWFFGPSSKAEILSDARRHSVRPTCRVAILHAKSTPLRRCKLISQLHRRQLHWRTAKKPKRQSPRENNTRRVSTASLLTEETHLPRQISSANKFPNHRRRRTQTPERNPSAPRHCRLPPSAGFEMPVSPFVPPLCSGTTRKAHGDESRLPCRAQRLTPCEALRLHHRRAKPFAPANSSTLVLLRPRSHSADFETPG